MPFSDSEIAEHTSTLEAKFWSFIRPPLHLRDRIREGQRFEGGSLELFFVRPAFGDPVKWIEDPIAKIRFVRSTGVWRLYWQRADLKWHSYPPCPETGSLSEALEIIKEDANRCFFG
jgi:hypothetical protein